MQVFDIFLDLNQVAIQLWFHPSTASSKCMNCNQKVFIYIKTTKVEHPPFPMWLGLEPRQSEKKQASLQKAMFNTRKSNVENLGREEKKKKSLVLQEKPEEVKGCLVLAEAAMSSSGGSRQIKRS